MPPSEPKIRPATSITANPMKRPTSMPTPAAAGFCEFSIIWRSDGSTFGMRSIIRCMNRAFSPPVIR